MPSYAVEHWNGRTWKYVAIPRALSGYAAASVALAAGSADDAWLLDGFPRGGKALFWHGRQRNIERGTTGARTLYLLPGAAAEEHARPGAPRPALRWPRNLPTFHHDSGWSRYYYRLPGLGSLAVRHSKGVSIGTWQAI